MAWSGQHPRSASHLVQWERPLRGWGPRLDGDNGGTGLWWQMGWMAAPRPFGERAGGFVGRQGKGSSLQVASGRSLSLVLKWLRGTSSMART